MNTLRDFQCVGQDLFTGRLNNSHSGNMSVRIERMIAITRTGSMLHRLEYTDIIETLLEGEDSQTVKASRELPVHRAIYMGTKAQAIVHAHPPHVVALSMISDHIQPIDAEGRYYFPEGVCVLTVKDAVGSEEVAAGIVPLFAKRPLAVVRGHGTFAIGADLEECLHWTSSLDNSAQIILLNKRFCFPSKL